MNIKETELNNIAWRVAQIIEKQNKDMRPSWSAIERSPDAGLRRKEVGEAMDKLMKIAGEVVEYDSTLR